MDGNMAGSWGIVRAVSCTAWQLIWCLTHVLQRRRRITLAQCLALLQIYSLDNCTRLGAEAGRERSPLVRIAFGGVVAG
jgi:hypothetical protein